MTEARTAEQHASYLSDCTTEHLLYTYRQLPSYECLAELDRRGVVLWHYGLARLKARS
jgi:hypothetical protein